MYQQFNDFLTACYPFGYPLLACSFILISAIVFHLLSRNSNKEIARLEQSWEQGSSALLAHTQEDDSPLAKEVLFIAQHSEDDDTSLREQVETRLRLFVNNQRSGLTTMSIIINIAPMLGILGTAWGLVDIFAVFGAPGAEALISQGISKALYTTIFGLAIAVPGVIALSSFERKLEQRAARILVLFASIIAKRQQL